MKHISLFESFSQEKGPFLIGYYGEGGIGSHPAIFTKEHLKEFGFRNENPPGFVPVPDTKAWVGPGGGVLRPLLETQTCPDSLLCGFEPLPGWDIKPIFDSSTSQKIMEIIDEFGRIDPSMKNQDYMEESDLMYDEEEQEKISELFDRLSAMTGVLKGARRGERSVSLIYGVSPNTIYWSPNPEETHGYWKPPYDALSLEDLPSYSGYDEDEYDEDEYEDK